ncbi:acyltransferase [Atlantibacter sp.]|uniref:acyltransferase n=1 Tax=Atlantibacter sp. TaxID=1903473 RepID=UPI0028AC5F7B|nr:acyltransferase [Atlantibacter sp.]
MNFDEFVSEVISKDGNVIGKPVVWKSVSIDLKSKGTSFEFDSNSKVDGLSLVDYGGSNTIILGCNSKLSGVVKLGKSCKLVIGDNFSVTGGLKLHLSEAKDIIIGDDCMFGIDVSIYNHDYHPVFSLDSGERLNFSQTVIIENNVWLANKVTVLKGVTIHNGAIIGLGSLVTKDIEKKSLAVGSPAIVIKKDVVWSRASLNTSHPNGINNISEL